MPKMPTAREIFDAAFNRPRQPRSDAYRRGVLASLENREQRANSRPGDAPYLVDARCGAAIGSAECDAFYAGVDEGHALYAAACVVHSPRGTP